MKSFSVRAEEVFCLTALKNQILLIAGQIFSIALNGPGRFNHIAHYVYVFVSISGPCESGYFKYPTGHYL